MNRPITLVYQDSMLTIDLSSQKDLRIEPILNAAEAQKKLLQLTRMAAAPWLDARREEFLAEATKESLVIFVENIDPYVTALAMHVLQLGFRTFLVLPNDCSALTIQQLRLIQSGVTVLSSNDFLIECALGE